MELAGPILLRSGTPGQVAALVAPMASGDSIWCQLFSEPEAGLRSRRAPHVGPG